MFPWRVMIYTKPKNMTDEKYKFLNWHCVGFTRQWLDDNIYHHMANKTSTNVLWNKLESLYKRKTANNKLYVFKRFVNLKYIYTCSKKIP